MSKTQCHFVFIVFLLAAGLLSGCAFDGHLGVHKIRQREMIMVPTATTVLNCLGHLARTRIAAATLLLFQHSTNRLEL